VSQRATFDARQTVRAWFVDDLFGFSINVHNFVDHAGAGISNDCAIGYGCGASTVAFVTVCCPVNNLNICVNGRPVSLARF